MTSDEALRKEPMIDLKPFCGTDECRPYLLKPFSRDGFTYATDGCIMVRVALRPDIPDVSKQFNQNKPLERIEVAQFFRPKFELPPAPNAKGPCPDCEGRGREHDCESCECICETCDGEGDLDIEKRISTDIGPQHFSLYYTRMMLSLPGIEIASLPEETNEEPLLFRFNEGVGALMPMRRPYDNHVDIKVRADE